MTYQPTLFLVPLVKEIEDSGNEIFLVAGNLCTKRLPLDGVTGNQAR